MIEYRRGDLFDSGAIALVNTVNCVGIMGKGIALEFKKRFPNMYYDYQVACMKKQLFPGGIFPWYNEANGGWIINVATKNHWRNPSQMEWIDLGIRLIRTYCIDMGTRTVAIPPLGCGNGGLNWTEVAPKIDYAFRPLETVNAFVYPPSP